MLVRRWASAERNTISSEEQRSTASFASLHVPSCLGREGFRRYRRFGARQHGDRMEPVLESTGGRKTASGIALLLHERNGSDAIRSGRDEEDDRAVGEVVPAVTFL